MEHRRTSFFNSCVKVPVDPYSRQPTPSYERPRLSKSDYTEKARKINFANNDQLITGSSETSSPRETLENFLEFIASIPDYGQVHHLSNEQFKQKVDYLRRKQRLFLKNLKNSFEDLVKDDVGISTSRNLDPIPRNKQQDDICNLKLSGKKCYLEESRTSSPILFSTGTFAGLAADQDLLTYRGKDRDKEGKTVRNREIHSADKSWRMWNEYKNDENADKTDTEDSIETKSLPPSISKEWHPTVPKPFNFTLREEAEKYMTKTEIEAGERVDQESSKGLSRKRRVRPIPLTSKIPLYDKLLAKKEERSRMIREESALNLMSQVRPFRLECERRAWRSMSRSSPELRSKVPSSLMFKAKPVPKNLFDTEVYDRMLEDEYYRQLQKKVRAAELMKSSSLPPSMARRERMKSAYSRTQGSKDCLNEDNSRVSSSLLNDTPVPSERSRSVMTMLSSRGNNLAAVLRCKASREKLEREIREQMEEKRREQAMKFRESLISRKPAWRALRSAARYEHERDLDLRTSLRRDEAREQAERHRLQMEMMLDRVTQIPTLFERHSQTYQSLVKVHSKSSTKDRCKKKKKLGRQVANSIDSYVNFGNNSRPDSGSITSSTGTLVSLSQSSKSSNSSGSQSSRKSVAKSENSAIKKKEDRGPLKVSINETAELIEDHNDDVELYSENTPSEARENDDSESEENNSGKE